MNEMFTDFVKSLQQNCNIELNDSELTIPEKEFIGTVYNSVIDFLKNNQLVDLTPNTATALENINEPLTQLSPVSTLVDIGPDSILDLCRQTKIPSNKQYEAASKVALIIEKYTNGAIKNEHFSNDLAVETLDKNINMQSFDSMYSSAAITAYTHKPETEFNIAHEAFGLTMDQTYLDAKIAITVTLLEFHKSILVRLLPVKPIDGELVTFKVDRIETYDLKKASAGTASERYGSHRQPFIKYYKDPSGANTSPEQIIPLTSNDPDNKYLIKDGVTKTKVKANLFDLSIIPNKIGFDRIDYSDLVGEGAKVSEIYVQITDSSTSPATVEVIPITIEHLNGSRFSFPTNAAQSADRIANVESVVKLDDTTTTDAQTASSILSFLDDDNHYIKLGFIFNAKLNLMTSDVYGDGSLTPELVRADGQPIDDSDPMKSSYDSLQFELIGHSTKAYFSPENLRKVSSAIRILTSIVAYPIPPSKTIAVDYSIRQSSPDTVINALTEYLAIGNDDRGVKLILDNIEFVNRKLLEEKQYNIANDYQNSLLNEFVAGYKVMPSVFTGEFDVSEVDSIRGGDVWGDIRTAAEKYLVEVISKLMNGSFYKNQLAPGESLTFSVLTSGYILNGLLSVPFYHTDLNNGIQKNPNDIVEYRRILPGSDTVLNIITTNFDYMVDKILMVPVRPTQPSSELNYAQIADKGTYVAQLTAYSGESSAIKRVVANSRQIPIITCPVAALVTVKNLSQVFNGEGNL